MYATINWHFCVFTQPAGRPKHAFSELHPSKIGSSGSVCWTMPFMMLNGSFGFSVVVVVVLRVVVELIYLGVKFCSSSICKEIACKTSLLGPH